MAFEPPEANMWCCNYYFDGLFVRDFPDGDKEELTVMGFGIKAYKAGVLAERERGLERERAAFEAGYMRAKVWPHQVKDLPNAYEEYQAKLKEEKK